MCIRDRGHQNCGTCHPDTKAGRAADKKPEYRWSQCADCDAPYLDERCPRCGPLRDALYSRIGEPATEDLMKWIRYVAQNVAEDAAQHLEDRLEYEKEVK